MKSTEFGHSITFISQNWDKYPNFTHSKLSDVGNSDFDNDRNKKQLHVDRNTWRSWGLVPNARPTLPHPKQKTRVVEGLNTVDGSIDLSWTETPWPVFENREGSFTFIYNPILQDSYNKYKPWIVLYSEISDFLHGRKLRMVLEDDPGYYYEGRFWVENWTSNTDGSGSTITIGYNVEPYKMSILSTLNDWLWDPFNFYNGDIKNNKYFKIDVSSFHYYEINNDNYNRFIQNITASQWETYGYGITLFGLTGLKAQIPTIYWKPRSFNKSNKSYLKSNNRALFVNYVNDGYGINYYKNQSKGKFFDPIGSWGVTQNIDGSPITSLSSPGVTNYLFNDGKAVSDSKDSMGEGYYKFGDIDMIFRDCYFGENYSINFIGDGTVIIDFRRGDL